MSLEKNSPQASGEKRFEELYSELRRIAARAMAGERKSHTLQPTALVNEAYLRLRGQADVAKWNRDQFLALASKMMRRVLVDHARAAHAEKRGGGASVIGFDEAIVEQTPDPSAPQTLTSVLALDTALTELSKINPRCAKVVELRAFSGLSIDEIAKEVDASPATVKRDFLFAVTWLKSNGLGGGAEGADYE